MYGKDEHGFVGRGDGYHEDSLPPECPRCAELEARIAEAVRSWEFVQHHVGAGSKSTVWHHVGNLNAALTTDYAFPPLAPGVPIKELELK